MTTSSPQGPSGEGRLNQVIALATLLNMPFAPKYLDAVGAGADRAVTTAVKRLHRTGKAPGPKGRARLRATLKTALLTFCVALVSLLSLEGLTRLFLDDGTLYELEMWKYAREVKVRDHRPDIGHRHRPNAHAELMGQDLRTDSHGFRSLPILDKPGSSVARIAFVGDSIALGWGVAEKETFANQVIAALQASGRKVDGYNMGVGNYNTTQELALFRDVGAAMKPDIIVVAYFINDAEPMPQYGDWLAEHAAAWVVFRYRVDSLFRQFGEAPDWKHYYRALYKPDAEGWRQTQAAITAFAQEARKIDAQLIVFNIPELRELKPYPFEDITAKVRKAVETQGVPFVDLLPTVQELDPASLWVTVPDPHPNGKAHITFAKAMLPPIVAMLNKLCRERGKGCAEQ
jgi:lysophospholipase L1-like esterase